MVYIRSLGLPRSPEAIRGYCRAEKPEATTTGGLKGEQHVIRRESARIFIEDRKRILAAMSRNDLGDDGITRKLPVTSVMSRDIPDDDGRAHNVERIADAASTEAAKDTEIARLRDEVMSLKIDKAARDQIVSMLREERSKISEEAMSANRKVGDLEARMQLGAPADHGVIRIHRSDDQQDGGIDADRVY